MTKRTIFLWAIGITTILIAILIYLMVTDTEPATVNYGRPGITEFTAINYEVCGGDTLTYNLVIRSVNENSAVEFIHAWATVDVPGLPSGINLQTLSETYKGVLIGSFSVNTVARRVVPEFLNSRPGVWEYRQAIQNGSAAIYFVRFKVPEDCAERSTKSQ